MKINKIIFCGLSHLSLNYGVTASKLFKNVIFFDFKKKIKSFINNELNFDEPNLDIYLKKYKKNIKFVSELPSDFKHTIIFIALDIKTSNKNISNYSDINKLLHFVTNSIENKNFPLVVMSQVQPNFTRSINWPTKHLYYQVETLVFGEAIKRAEKPERIIVGTDSGIKINDKIYLDYLKVFKCPIIQMNYEEAELCKMFINSYLVSDVVLTNLLSSLCKKMNLNWQRPLEALKLDKRIGNYAYLNPGLGISGGNLERDIINLSKISNKFNINDALFKVFLSESSSRKKWLINIVNKYNKKPLITHNSKVGIVGIAYKEKINSFKNSPSLLILKNFNNKKLFCYDELLKNQLIDQYDVNWVSIQKLVYDCEIIFIMHSHPYLKTFNFNNSKVKFIIDPYKILDKSKLNLKIIYETL